MNKYLAWLKEYDPLGTVANQNSDSVLKSIASVHEAASMTASQTGGLDISALLLCIQLNEDFRKMMQ